MSVPEVPAAREHHRSACRIHRIDDILIALRPTRLHDRGGTCVEGRVNYDSRCGELGDQWSSAYTSRDVAIASFAIGGAAAAGALVYVLWPAPKKRSASVKPIVGAGFLGLDASF